MITDRRRGRRRRRHMVRFEGRGPLPRSNLGLGSMPRRPVLANLDRSSQASLFADCIRSAPKSSAPLAPLPRRRRLPIPAAREAAERATRRLAGDPRIRLVYLFGSAALVDRTPVGDIDLGILASPALPLREILRLQADLGSRAGCDLDLVSLDEASIVLAWEVVRYGECLYSASAEVEMQFVTRAQRRYWDFKPFLDRQWDLTARRAEERLRDGRQT